MLSTTVVHVCPHCGGERLQKNGRAEHGAQRAKCVDCQRTFVLSPQGPRYDQKFKAQVVAAYQDRMSIRGITRTFGVCYQTVMAWVGEKIRGLPAFEDTLLPSKKGDVLELDELWSFVGTKEQPCWLWIALCRRTRQIVAYPIGDRSKEAAQNLREHVPGLSTPGDAQRLLVGLRRGVSKAHPSFLRQAGRRDQPRRTLLWHAAFTSQPLSASRLLLLQKHRTPP